MSSKTCLLLRIVIMKLVVYLQEKNEVIRCKSQRIVDTPKALSGYFVLFLFFVSKVWEVLIPMHCLLGRFVYRVNHFCLLYFVKFYIGVEDLIANGYFVVEITLYFRAASL